MQAYPELRPYADRPELAIVSAVFVLLFALPSFVALMRWLGARRGVAALVALGVFATAVETIAVETGFPYGRFSYGQKIGGKIFGAVPWTVPFAWTPLLLAAFALAWRWTHSTTRGAQPPHTRQAQRQNSITLIIGSALLVTALDGVLDPGAVAQNFWKYQHPSAYYGVPLSNFAGWILSGALGAMILLLFVERAAAAGNATAGRFAEPPAGLLGSAFLILVFWTSVCFWSALWLPALLGVILLGVISPALFQS